VKGDTMTRVSRWIGLIVACGIAAPSLDVRAQPRRVPAPTSRGFTVKSILGINPSNDQVRLGESANWHDAFGKCNVDAPNQPPLRVGGPRMVKTKEKRSTGTVELTTLEMDFECGAAAQLDAFSQPVTCPTIEQLSKMLGNDLIAAAPAESTWATPETLKCLPIKIPQPAWFVIGDVQKTSPDRFASVFLAVDASSHKIIASASQEVGIFGCQYDGLAIDKAAGSTMSVRMKETCLAHGGHTDERKLAADILPPKITLRPMK
jgi:hypothetical protein